MSPSFLAGYRVLDLGQYVPGPYGALILADLGAGVVKVEPPGGEPFRGLGPIDSDGVSAWYKVINRNKTVVEIDLKTKAGQADFEALAARADALVESYRPGVLDRLGLSHAHLAARNPGLVHCALSGWGQTGPYRLKGGHDVNYLALMGGLVASGPAAGPLMAFPPAADYASGMQAALTVLAALLGRDRPGGDGRGRFLDLSIAESVLPWQAVSLTGARRAGFAPARERALLNGGAAFYRVYRTRDSRFVTLGALEAKFWANFCAAVGRPDWIARQFEPMPQEALIAELAALFAGRDLAALNELLGEVDCCFEPVHELTETLAHPQLAARQLLNETPGPEPRVEVAFPAWIDGAPPARSEPLRFASAAQALMEWGREAGD